MLAIHKYYEMTHSPIPIKNDIYLKLIEQKKKNTLNIPELRTKKKARQHQQQNEKINYPFDSVNLILIIRCCFFFIQADVLRLIHII